MPVVFYKNVFVFLDLVVFCKNVLSYFKKSYVSISTLKYAYKFMLSYLCRNTLVLGEKGEGRSWKTVVNIGLLCVGKTNARNKLACILLWVNNRPNL